MVFVTIAAPAFVLIKLIEVDDRDACDRFVFRGELSNECVPKLESGMRLSMRIFSPFLSTTVTLGAGMRAVKPLPVGNLSVE